MLYFVPIDCSTSDLVCAPVVPDGRCTVVPQRGEYWGLLLRRWERRFSNGGLGVWEVPGGNDRLEGRIREGMDGAEPGNRVDGTGRLVLLDEPHRA